MKHRHRLPQLYGDLFLTDGGIETSLIFHEGLDLPLFASTKSHAELDEATELDAGDPAELGARCAALRTVLPRLNVLGGCCGSDDRHLREICGTWLARSAPTTG